MIEKLPPEKFIELVDKQPQDLQDMLLSDMTGKDIQDICERNKMMEDLDYMINGVGDVFLGLLSPADFFEGLRKQSKANPGTIKEAINEINRFLFFPVKDSLEKVYNLQCATDQAPKPEGSPQNTVQ